MSRVLDQNGVSQACYIVEIYHSGMEPSCNFHSVKIDEFAQGTQDFIFVPRDKKNLAIMRMTNTNTHTGTNTDARHTHNLPAPPSPAQTHTRMQACIPLWRLKHFLT